MGVTRGNGRHNSVTLDFNQSFDMLDENNVVSTDEDNTAPLLTEEDLRAIKRHDRKQRKLMQRSLTKLGSPTKPEAMFRGLGCRGRSKQKKQRYENGNLLATSIAATFGDLELDDTLDIYDFVPRTVSAFAQLLMEKESMIAWNSFINSSEEDQNTILDSVADFEDQDGLCLGHKKNSRRKYHSEGDAFDTSRLQDDSDSSSSDDENKRSHPGFCPKSAFERLDSKIKRLFRQQRKPVPIGLLESMEEDVVSFFEQEGVDAIYESRLPSSFQRLLLHATAQYLNLMCKSHDRSDGRWSNVMKKRNEPFARPSVKLAAYIQTAIRKEREHPSNWGQSA